MSLNAPVIAVVDDDASVRESLPDLLHELGYAVRTFSSAEEFLACDCIEDTRCLLVDVSMPGASGFELASELKKRGHDIPIVFMTAGTLEDDGERPMDSRAAWLFKPFSELALLEAIAKALADR